MKSHDPPQIGCFQFWNMPGFGFGSTYVLFGLQRNISHIMILYLRSGLAIFGQDCSTVQLRYGCFQEIFKVKKKNKKRKEEPYEKGKVI